MASLLFRFDYTADYLPAWEASRTLRGLTHLYYYYLLVTQEKYFNKLDTIFEEHGKLPEDLTAHFEITSDDRLILEVQNLSPSLSGRVTSNDENTLKNVSDVIQDLKDLAKK